MHHPQVESVRVAGSKRSVPWVNGPSNRGTLRFTPATRGALIGIFPDRRGPASLDVAPGRTW